MGNAQPAGAAPPEKDAPLRQLNVARYELHVDATLTDEKRGTLVGNKESLSHLEDRLFASSWTQELPGCLLRWAHKSQWPEDSLGLIVCRPDTSRVLLVFLDATTKDEQRAMRMKFKWVGLVVGDSCPEPPKWSLKAAEGMRTRGEKLAEEYRIKGEAKAREMREKSEAWQQQASPTEKPKKVHPWVVNTVGGYTKGTAFCAQGIDKINNAVNNVTWCGGKVLGAVVEPPLRPVLQSPPVLRTVSQVQIEPARHDRNVT